MGGIHSCQRDTVTRDHGERRDSVVVNIRKWCFVPGLSWIGINSTGFACNHR